MGGILDVLANYNPTAFAQGNQQREATIADTEAQVAQRASENALRQQQTQAAALANQQAQRDVRDQQAIQEAWRQSDGDPTRLIKGVIQKGGSPKAVMELQSNIIKQTQARAAAKVEENKVFAEQHSAAAAQFEAALAAPPGQEQAAWDLARQTLIKQGLADPGELQANYPGQDWLKMHMNGALVQGGIAKKQADAQEQSIKAQKLEADKAEEQRKSLGFPIQQAKAEAEATYAQQRAAGTEKIQPAEQATINATAERNKQLASDAQARLVEEQKRTTLEGQRVGIEAKKYTAEFGGDAVKGWAKTLEDNPDAAGSVPAALRTAVQSEFTKSTGLPYPKPLSGQTKTAETAARNALDGISFIQKALENPEIRANIGPIMGRLGNLEQSIGTAPNLSPEAAQLAQELRTRMRYFVFQEGKAVLGGRLPAQLMQQLEESSASPKMDADTLKGALTGALGNAQSVLDNADRERFGGKMRSRQQRGAEAPAGPADSKYKPGDSKSINGVTYVRNDKGEWHPK